METIEKTEFKYDELSPEAQAFALEKADREQYIFDEWWDDTYDDVKAIGIAIGIEIDDISFSGFWSQGDGASFDGRLRIPVMQNAVAQAKAFCNDEKVLAFAHRAELIYLSLLPPMMARKLQNIEGSYLCLDSVLYIEGKTRGYTTKVYDTLYEYPDDFHIFEDDMNSFVSDFADYIYDRLEAEYEYLTSDETIIDTLENGDELFGVDGSII